ncbi:MULTISPECIES: sulfite exporter TauE/SafE family protein [Actinomyces]|uniref:Probable membrane transporter protein n=1 Tax=Actinomyces respiraculi TaxID=2744574 RepID=A0A7T0PXC7_9ACTO|nr:MULTISPECIES: sulfite exporter TauE/SafE family protein [Actinomyces]QPL06669.1 sulfite exporter TauE/SafE family protein [Actinomyces respiraculi]
MLSSGLAYASSLPASTWAILVVAAAATGIAKTALPGAATLAVALFAAVLPAKESTGTMLVLLLIGDVLAIWMYRHDADWSELRRLVPGVLAGVVLGAVFLHLVSDEAARRLIGALLLVLIAATLALMRLPEPPEVQGPLGRAIYGTAAGFTTMAANAGGPVTTMYFLASRFSVMTFLGTTAWFFFTVNLVKLPLSIGLGLIRAETLWVDLALVPVVIVSALAGRWLAARMDKRIFDPLVTILTVASAAHLLV